MKETSRRERIRFGSEGGLSKKPEKKQINSVNNNGLNNERQWRRVEVGPGEMRMGRR